MVVENDLDRLRSQLVSDIKMQAESLEAMINNNQSDEAAEKWFWCDENGRWHFCLLVQGEKIVVYNDLTDVEVDDLDGLSSALWTTVYFAENGKFDAQIRKIIKNAE